jgi:hypothetical protein
MIVKYLKIFIFVIIFSLIAQSAESRKIPTTFHWIHLKQTPLSHDEIQAIESWQITHPHWNFKLWTNTKCSLKNIIHCSVDPKITDLEILKNDILEREGGVWIHPDLIGCKSLDYLTDLCTGFISSDGSSIVGSAPGHFSYSKLVLPDHFILPDQIFQTEISSLKSSGVCFKKFKQYPRLTKKLMKIHQAPRKVELHFNQFKKLLSRSNFAFFIVIVLLPINGFLGCFLLLKMKRNHFHLSIKYGLPILFLLLICAAFYIYPTKNIALFPKEHAKADNFFYLPQTVETSLLPNDLKYLNIYNEIFSKAFSSLLTHTEKDTQIPHVIHFIWGGREFPKNSIENIVSWMVLHPNWTFKFWTDDPKRELPIPGMEKHLFEELELTHMGSFFPNAKNWGEKSDLLRYEILYREGGIYVDHDVECYRSFDSLCQNFAFFAPLEPAHKNPLIENHLTITNCLIGAKPAHPILLNTMENVKRQWHLADQLFTSEDKASDLMRTLKRTFFPFNSAVNESIQNEGILILPPSTVFPNHFPKPLIDSIRSQNCLFANHQWKNSWLKNEHETTLNEQTKQVKNQLIYFSKNLSKTVKWNCYIFAFLSTLSCFFWFKKKRTLYAKNTHLHPSLLPNH